MQAAIIAVFYNLCMGIHYSSCNALSCMYVHTLWASYTQLSTMICVHGSFRVAPFPSSHTPGPAFIAKIWGYESLGMRIALEYAWFIDLLPISEDPGQVLRTATTGIGTDSYRAPEVNNRDNNQLWNIYYCTILKCAHTGSWLLASWRKTKMVCMALVYGLPQS